MQWGTEPGSPQSCVRRSVGAEGRGPGGAPQWWGWALPPGAQVAVSLSDPGPEPTSLGLESGAPVRPLGTRGLERGLQVVQVSVGALGLCGWDVPTLCAPGVTLWAGEHDREAVQLPLVHISIVRTLRTPVIKKVITCVYFKTLQNNLMVESCMQHQILICISKKTLGNADPK